MKKLFKELVTPAVLLLTGVFAFAQGPNHQNFQVHPLAPPQKSANAVILQARPVRVGPEVRVNAPQQPFPFGLLGRSETSIAASNGGRHLLVGFNDAQGFCDPLFGGGCTNENPPGLSGYAFSTDGGLTWIDGGAPDPALSPAGNVFTRGDPWMGRGGFDGQTFYYANLAVDRFSGGSLGVSVHRGHFNGGTFAFEDVRTFNSPNPNDAYDKDAMAVSHSACDDSESGPCDTANEGSGAAYVSISNFIEVCEIPAFGFGQIELWRTHDGGDSWQGPTIVSPDLTFITNPSDPNCGLTGTIQQGSVPAIGPHGEVYVTWLQGPTFSGNGGSIESTNATIQVATSLDGGVTFGTPVKIARTNVSNLRTAPAGYNRFSRLDSPRIAVADTGRNHGRVYVTFTSEVRPAPVPGTVTCPSGLPTGSVCVGQDPLSEEAFISFSDDKGLTWSRPTPIAPPVPKKGVKRMWAVPSVEPGGNVDVVYYESQEAATSSNLECVMNLQFTNVFRVGPANSLVDTLWVQSTDGGSSFRSPVRVTTVTSNWCTTLTNIVPNFGDYIDSISGANRVFPVWADGRNDVPDTFFAPVKGKSH